MAESVRSRVIVSGVVQGVWFRVRTQEQAQFLGVSGWVRNLSDGSVEAVFEGDPGAVDAAVAWCGYGPDHAVVENVERFAEEPEGLLGFEIRP